MINKTFRDIVITGLALGTAYGLGVLSCVYFELKVIGEILDATSRDSRRYEYKEES